MPPDDYIQLVASAHVVLDTFHFGGSNTAYDSFAANVPSVTLPGPTPASRYVAALYDLMEIEDGVASSADDYVARAVAIATDSDRRVDLVDRIKDRSDAIFKSQAAVEALQDFFARALAE